MATFKKLFYGNNCINWIALDVRWSVKYFFCSIFRNSLDKGRKQIARQLQGAIFNKQLQKADTHLVKGIRDKNKHILTLFHWQNTFALFLLMIHFTAFLSPWWLTYSLYLLPQSEVLKYLCYKYISQIKSHPIYCSI